LLIKIPRKKRNAIAFKRWNFLRICKSDEFSQTIQNDFTIGEVELNVNYVLIISTNAGLWLQHWDTVQFTSLKPYRVVVSGRIKHSECIWRTCKERRSRNGFARSNGKDFSKK
jgi:hypothetical protein